MCAVAWSLLYLTIAFIQGHFIPRVCVCVCVPVCACLCVCVQGCSVGGGLSEGLNVHVCPAYVLLLVAARS